MKPKCKKKNNDTRWQHFLFYFRRSMVCVTPSDLWPLQVETVTALRVVEPGRLEDEPVLSAPCRPRPLAAGVGQQHLREAHLHGAEGALREALQEEGAFAVTLLSRLVAELLKTPACWCSVSTLAGSPAPLPAGGGDGAEPLLRGNRAPRLADRRVPATGCHQGATHPRRSQTGCGQVKVCSGSSATN